MKTLTIKTLACGNIDMLLQLLNIAKEAGYQLVEDEYYTYTIDEAIEEVYDGIQREYELCQSIELPF